MANNRKTVSVTKTYRYLVFPDGERVRVNRGSHAQFIRLLRTEPDVAKSGISVAVETRVMDVYACIHCQSRPAVWEYDCDGPFLTYYCDHPMCVKGRRIAYEGLSRESAETIQGFFR